MAQASTTLYAPGIWHNNLTHSMADIRRGGQFGWHSDFSGIVNSTPHVSNNIICRVLSSPRGFNKLPKNAAVWHSSFKALFELHAKSITGLNQTLNPSWNGDPWSGTGEQIEVPIGMTREVSSVEFTFNEKYGLPITHMVNAYHRMFIMDEDTRHPTISMIADEPITDGLLDFYTWSMIFIEPARYLEHANRCWMITNMGIKTAPEQTAKRDKTSDGELLDISLQMSGVAQVGYAVDALGNRILKAMKATQSDPLRAPHFMTGYDTVQVNGVSSGFTADVADAKDVGFYEAMQQAKTNMTTEGV